MHRTKVTLVGCALAAWFAGQAAQAGVVIEQEQREPGRPAVTGRTTLQLDAGRLRVESTDESGEQHVMIFRADRSVVWMIDPKQRTYSELTKARVEQMRGQMDAARREMAEQLAQLPPEQRQAVEQMMGQRMGASAPVSVHALGAGEPVGTFTCTRYEILRGSERLQEVCAAPLAQLHVTAEDIKTFTELGRMLEPLGQKATAGQWSALESINGFPVRSISYHAGRAVLEERLVRAEQKALDPGLFELPAGYRRVELERGER